MIINGKRSLAHIETVASIEPIEGADNICKVYVLGWALVAKKSEFNVGDKCVYIEIDSKVPEDDVRFAFLANKGFKVKTMKLGKFNVISQGLALNLNEFPELKGKDIGTDVTDILKIEKILTNEEKRLAKEAKFASENAGKRRWNNAYKKHEKFFKTKLGAWMMKKEFFRKFFAKIWGGKVVKPKTYPSWIVKTDEERIENLPQLLSYKKPLIVTEKIDGTSTTLAIRFKDKKHKTYESFICSRNVRQENEEQSCYFEDNVYWQMWKKYSVEDVLFNLAKLGGYDIVILQGETFGNKLQGNPYKLDYVDFKGFNLKIGYAEGSDMFKVISSDPEQLKKYNRVGDTLQKRINSIEAEKIMKGYGIPWVPIISTDFIMPDTMEEMKQLATGTSTVSDVLREGYVYRSETDQNVSFKNVSREYLMKHNQ